MPQIQDRRTKYQHRPIGHYRPICWSVCLCLCGHESQPYQSGLGEEEKGYSGKDFDKRKVNFNFNLNVNFLAIPAKQFLYNQQSSPDIIYRHSQSSVLLVDAPFRSLYNITD